MLIQVPKRLTGQINIIHQKVGDTFLVIAALVMFSTIFVILAGSTVGETTVQYDEFTDIVIASRLSQHPLSGHTYDGSQSRFPMYATAAAYRIIQTFNPSFEMLDILPVSRWLSIMMTVLAIWGTYLLGARLFNASVGLFASALFTFSPYVLHFGHVALTQGDAFTAAPVVFSLISFIEFTNKRTTLWLFAFSFCLALAIAAKFFLLVLIPAFIAFHLLLEISKRFRKPDPYSIDFDEGKTSSHKTYLLLAAASALLVSLAVILAYNRFDQPTRTSQLITLAARLAWGGSLLGIFWGFFLAVKKLSFRPFGIGKPDTFWGLSGAWLVVLLLTFAEVLALFPAHIFNRLILTTLFERFITLDGNTNILATSLVSAKLYLGLLLLKSGLPFGIATFVALGWALRKSIQQKWFLLLAVVLVFYGLMLAVLPLQQPFWLISIYPLLMLLVAAFFLVELANLRSLRLRTISAVYAVFAFCWLLLGIIQVYPMFAYYGYETVGDRWMGGDSRGYTGVVVVTNDGSTEAIEWLRRNVSAGSTVVSFLDDIHIVNYLDSIQPFTFELVHASPYQDTNLLIEELERADYVVVRPIDGIDFAVPSTGSPFDQHFSNEPIYQIFRGRGVYEMPVVQIYNKGRG